MVAMRGSFAGSIASEQQMSELDSFGRPKSGLAYIGRKIYRKLTLRKWRRTRANRRKLKHALSELAKFPKNPAAPMHGLPGKLIISLTSYPARFHTLHLTLKSLLDQQVQPDRILLWVAHDDLPQLPTAVRELEGDRFAVGACEDLRNFKKILPAHAAHPDAFLLICDDDTYYPDDWLKGLVDAFDPKAPSIVCYRAHRIAYLPDGSVAPYRQWQRNAADADTAIPRTDILPTGNGGVLYPPGSLPSKTGDLALIRRLSATSDDIWLYFMWRQAGWKVKRVPGRKREFTEWPQTQDGALWVLHRTGKKDEHIQDMSRHFGVP
jgi:hypothetical protein